MDRRRDQSQSPYELAAALLASLRDGSAGSVSRLGLSLASAAAGIGSVMVVLGLAEASSHRIRDEHVALGAMLVLLVWVGALYGLWATYSRKRHVVKTVFACIGIAVLTAGISGLLGAFLRNPEFFMAGMVFLGIAALAATVTAALHRGVRGREITAPDGAVSVHCPGCSYDMSGLDTTACPECGAKPTLDQLIRAQDYEALRVVRRSMPALPGPEAGAGALPAATSP